MVLHQLKKKMNFCIIFCFTLLFLTAHIGLPFKANRLNAVGKLICYRRDRAFCPSLSFPVIFTILVELCTLAGSSAVRRWWRQITIHASLITHISISVEFEPPNPPNPTLFKSVCLNVRASPQVIVQRHVTPETSRSAIYTDRYDTYHPTAEEKKIYWHAPLFFIFD